MDILKTIQFLPGVGPRRAEAFERLGCSTLEQLDRHCPREWLDATRFVPIADRLPAVLQPCGRSYDRWQAWLRIRLIGLRCSEHRAFLARQRWPRRWIRSRAD